MDLRTDARHLFDDVEKRLNRLTIAVLSDKNYMPDDAAIAQYQEVLNNLQSKKTTNREDNALSDCVREYCSLRKKAVAKDDDLDMEFITHEELMNLKEVCKTIMSALKERCEIKEISILTKDADCQGRLSWVYRLARKICNALSTIARALQKLKGTIHYRSLEEQYENAKNEFESVSRSSRNGFWGTISSRIHDSISKCFNDEQTTEYIKFSSSTIIATATERIKRNRLSDLFVTSDFGSFSKKLLKGDYTSKDFYDLAVDYGRWHAAHELCYCKSFTSFNDEVQLFQDKNKLGDSLLDPMLTIEKKELLKRDLENFVVKETGYSMECVNDHDVLQKQKQQIIMTAVLFLGMACAKKTLGFISALYEGLKKLKEHINFFLKCFFDHVGSKYLVSNSIDNLMILFEHAENNFKNATQSASRAQRLKMKLTGFVKSFPNCCDEHPFRKFLSKLHDMAESCFNNNFVATRYGITFA